MNEVLIYESLDGTRFDKKEDCAEYELTESVAKARIGKFYRYDYSGSGVDYHFNFREISGIKKWCRHTCLHVNEVAGVVKIDPQEHFSPSVISDEWVEVEFIEVRAALDKAFSILSKSMQF